MWWMWGNRRGTRRERRWYHDNRIVVGRTLRWWSSIIMSMVLLLFLARLYQSGWWRGWLGTVMMRLWMAGSTTSRPLMGMGSNGRNWMYHILWPWYAPTYQRILHSYTFFKMNLHVILELKEFPTAWTHSGSSRWPMHILMGGADIV